MKCRILSILFYLHILHANEIDLNDSNNATVYLFEGDIIPDYETISSAYGINKANELAEQGIIEKPIISLRGTAPTFPLWREEYNNLDYYVIPIYIDPNYSAEARALIESSLKKLMRKSSVVRFRILRKMPTNGRSFLHMSTFGERTCASYIGRRDDKASSAIGQKVWVGYNCMKEGIIQHEVLHAMGFWHEQSRPDRDDYVTIHYSNIQSSFVSNFDKQNSIHSLGAPYDYDSVLHYSPYHFSSNGAKTISTVGNANDHRVGQRVGISAGDKLQIRLLYQCEKGPRTYAEFMKDKCTWECKCGLYMRGCNHKTEKYARDWVCKGNLVCVDNQCVKP